jgi:diguanylate cyclase (GGDEF)-like protein
MDSTAARRLVALFVPEGLLLIAAVILLQIDSLQEPLAALANFAAYGVFLVGALLAWRFHRNQLLLALIVLALADLGLASAEARQAIAVLLPLNLVLLALVPERGFLTPIGIARVTGIVLQIPLVLLYGRSEHLTALLDTHLLPQPEVPWTSLSDVALVATMAGFVVLLTRALLKPDATGRGFLWVLVTSVLAFNAGEPYARTIYLATAGLILVVAIIETSYSLAYRDGLTGLPARRALDEALRRLGGQYTVAMADVDHFKRLNDDYGHDTGDQVLRMVAARLGKVSGGGRAFRYGGEEFAILFPRKSVEDVLLFLESARQEIEDTRFKLRGPNRPRRRPKDARKGGRGAKRVTVTVSIGVAQPSEGQTNPLEVIDAADQALYRAKQAGRNRIEA